MEHVLKWWPLVIACLGWATSWGVQQSEIAQLKEDSRQYEQAMIQQSAIDERTKIMLEEQRNLKALLQQALQQLKPQQ